MSFLGPTWVDAIAGAAGLVGSLYLLLWSLCRMSALVDEDDLLYQPSADFDDATSWEWPA
jgi:hypothetical protein